VASRYADLLRQRRFLALSTAMLVDNSASWAFNTVFAFIVFDRTGSISWISLAVAARWVPALLLGPFAGLLGDRFERVRVLVTSAALSAAVMAVLAVLVGFGAPIVVLVVVSAVQALCATPYEPAVQGVVPDLVPERSLAAANGYLEVLRNGAVVIGPLVGSLFLVVDEPAVAVGVNAVSYLVPLVVALRLGIRSRPHAASASTGVFAELKAGATALLGERTAFVLVLACVVDTAIAGVLTVLSVPISVAVGTGADHYGYLLVASSLGSILAAGVATRLAARTRLAAVIAVSLVVQGAPVLLIVAFPEPWVAFLALLVSGAAMLVVDILAVTALQRDLPREYLSRVFGLFDTLLFGALVAVTAVAGVLAEQFGLDTMLLVLGIGVPVVVLLALPTLVASDRRTAAVAAALAPVVDLLEELDLFEGADRAVLERVAAAAERVELPAGREIIREGDPADDLWLLAAGELGVTATTAGALPPVTAPGYVGELGLMNRAPRSATVSAAAECSMLKISGEAFLQALEEAAPSPTMLTRAGARLARTTLPKATVTA
jgi:MFS family permease